MVRYKTIKKLPCKAVVVLFHPGVEHHIAHPLCFVDCEPFFIYLFTKLGWLHVHLSACESPPPLAQHNSCPSVILNSEVNVKVELHWLVKVNIFLVGTMICVPDQGGATAMEIRAARAAESPKPLFFGVTGCAQARPLVVKNHL